MSDNVTMDVSKQLIAKIFGDNWTDVTQISDSGSIIFKLLSTFNGVLLTLVVASFLYTMAIASANTANEGKPMGEKFSTMWVPIRAMLGVSLLVPVFGGLSVFQSVMLQGVEWSIDVANIANGQVYEFFFKETPSGDMYLSDVPGLAESARKMGKKVLEAALVQQYYLQKEGVGLKPSEPVTVTKAKEGTQVHFRMSAPNISSMRSRISDLNTLHIYINCKGVAEVDCKARENAVKSFITDIIPVAESSVAATMPEPGGDGFEKNVANYNIAITNYKEAMTAVAFKIAGQDEDRKNNAKNVLDFNKTHQKGWAVLGGYYWVASNQTKRTMEVAGDLPTIDEPALGWLTDFSVANGYAGAIEARADAIDKAIYQELEVEKKSWFGIFNAADNTSDYIARWAIGVDSGYDMLTGLQNVGHTLLTGCAVAMTVMAATVDISADGKSTTSGFIGKAAGWVTGKIPGVGIVKKFGGTLFANMGKAGFAALLILYPFAFYLAMGLPAIPLIYWILGVVNWLISVITLVVGATIWAAAISMPEGEGVAGNHGREGFMLFANCLLRPFLMVFGFIFAYLLIRCGGFLVYEILSVGLESMSAEYSRGFAVFVGSLAVYATITTVLIVKIFGFMIALPDIILTFVGKHLSGSGEHGDVEKTSGGMKNVSQGGGQTVGKMLAKPGV